MKYVPMVYGNKLAFTDKTNRTKREQLLAEDKNRVVYAACIFRRRWKEIEKFDDYRHNNEEGSWIITMYATEKFHKRFHKMLADPSGFVENIERYKRRYHRMARWHKTKNAGSED